MMFSSFKQADDLEFEIEYQGDTEKLVKIRRTSSSIFLSSFLVISMKDSVEISNDGDRDITLYFDSEF